MSLISSIKSRRLEDLINEGARTQLNGTITGSGSPQTILTLQTPASAGTEGQSIIITGYTLSSSAGSPVLVTLGFDNGSTIVTFFSGYIGGGQVVDKTFSLGDWFFGNLGDNLVINAPSGSIAYTISGRIIRGIEPLGYIEQIGTPNHANPYFGLESGAARGQSEF